MSNHWSLYLLFFLHRNLALQYFNCFNQGFDHAIISIYIMDIFTRNHIRKYKPIMHVKNCSKCIYAMRIASIPPNLGSLNRQSKRSLRTIASWESSLLDLLETRKLLLISWYSEIKMKHDKQEIKGKKYRDLKSWYYTTDGCKKRIIFLIHLGYSIIKCSIIESIANLTTNILIALLWK